MAVANPQAVSLAPLYGNIQEALGQRARLALQEPGGMGTAAVVSGAVKDITKELREVVDRRSLEILRSQLQLEADERERTFNSRYDFFLEDEEDLDDAADSIGIDKEVLRPFLDKKTRFKNAQDAFDTLTKRATISLSLLKDELEARDPKAVEEKIGGEFTSVATGSPQPVIMPGGEPGVQQVSTQVGLETNQQKMDALERKINTLQSSSVGQLTGTAAVKNIVPKKYFDRGEKVWKMGFYNRIERTFTKNPETDPIVPGTRHIKTEPGTGELKEFFPDLSEQARTGPEPTPRGELSSKATQLTEVQKKEIPKLKKELESNPTFKSTQITKLQTGNLLRLMSLDYASLTGQITTNIARSIGQEKGPLNEGDIRRSGGSEAIVDQFNIGFEKIKSGKFSEKTYNEFKDTIRLLNNNAVILEDKLVSDVVEDAREFGRFSNVDPEFMRKALAVPDATGFIDQRFKHFEGTEITDAMDFMREEEIPIEAETLLKTVTLLKQAKQRRR